MDKIYPFLGIVYLKSSLLALLLFPISFGYYASANENILNLADTPCGEVMQFSKSRILGGQVAGAVEFPFLASIQTSDGIHACSAFIVNKQTLVTAAHCFLHTMFGSNAYTSYQILVGSDDWADTRGTSSIYKISSVLIHPRYSYLKPNVENDIAILKIDRPLVWSRTVQPICLANGDFSNHKYGTVGGWGIRSQRETTKDWLRDTKLHKVSLPIWSNRDCQDEYRKHRVNWNTRPSHVCAGFQDEDRDTCEGDSGSPLVIVEGRKIAYGIVSVGEGCATKLPGIYTRVSSFIPWLKDNS